MRRARIPAMGLALAAALLGACDDPGALREFSAPRELSAATAAPRWNASSAERFGFGAPARQASGGKLEWDMPAGWLELAPTSMRQANFRVAGDERAECYLTLLAGDAGGLAANVNRWRAQMSAAPLGADEVAALERVEMMGGPAALVDVSGAFTGMGGGAAVEGYRMVGALRIASGGSAFLKMTGPADVIGAQLDAFRALARSFRRSVSANPHATGPGPASAGPVEPGSASIASGDSGLAGAGGLRWTMPSGWRVAPEKPMRLVGFAVDASGASECTITLLPGAAGGALANVNRWRGQLGRESIDAAALESLPRVSMLGASGTLVEVDGLRAGPDAGSAPEPAALLGAVGAVPGGSVFVKLVGPPALVAAERARFLELCASLAPSSQGGGR